jgi:hypothetical protein
MNAIYPARYRDKNGEVATTMSNNGKILSLVLRGVEFRGSDFDGLAPVEGDEQKLPAFTLSRGDLCSCTIEVEMPIPVVTESGTVTGLLAVHLTLGDPLPNSGLTKEDLTIELQVQGRILRSSGTSGWFEDEMLSIQKQMPVGMFMLACINCAFSDYSPAGHGLFGCLVCFRDNKQEYLSVSGKKDLFRIWNTLTEAVQETYLCPEFQQRIPGTGYRG